MEIVQKHDAATLLPIIQAHTAAGTIIHSDQWVAYNNVQSLPTVSSHQTESFSRICQQRNRDSHSKCGVLLEQKQDQNKTYERLPCGNVAQLPG